MTDSGSSVCVHDASVLRAYRLTCGLVHDPDYRVAVQDFNDFIGKLSERIVEIDETIPELPVKDIVSGLPSSAMLNTYNPRSTVYIEVREQGQRIADVIDETRRTLLKRPNALQGKLVTAIMTKFSLPLSQLE